MNDFATGAAYELLSQHKRQAQFRSLAPNFPVTDLSHAYDIQDALVTRLLQEQATTAVGYKIGLTSPRMQEMCGTNQPIAGVIAANRILRSPARLHTNKFGRLGIEFEICVRLASDLPRNGRAVTRDDVEAVVGSVAAAFEIIDDRNAEYAGLDILSVVADNSWNDGAILGEFHSSWPDLANVEARLDRDHTKVDSGWGHEILGHPFESVAWLANHLAARGRTLRAGQLVMTGSILRTLFPKVGETYRLDIGPIGNVEVTIAD